MAKVNPNALSAPTQDEARAMVMEGGFLGRCFGSVRTAPVNIAGATLAALVILGGALLFFDSKGMTSAEYWKLVTPVITLILGYLFAK
jgi:hypothetical protein